MCRSWDKPSLLSRLNERLRNLGAARLSISVEDWPINQGLHHLLSAAFLGCQNAASFLIQSSLT